MYFIGATLKTVVQVQYRQRAYKLYVQCICIINFNIDTYNGFEISLIAPAW